MSRELPNLLETIASKDKRGKSTTVRVLRTSITFLIVFQLIANVLYFFMPVGMKDWMYYNGLMFAISFSMVAWGVATWLGWESERQLGGLDELTVMIRQFSGQVKSFPDLMNKFKGIGYDIESMMPGFEKALRTYHENEQDIEKTIELMRQLIPYIAIAKELYAQRLDNADKLDREAKAEILKTLVASMKRRDHEEQQRKRRSFYSIYRANVNYRRKHT